MSFKGFRQAQLERQQLEQLRLQHVQMQAQAELAACEEAIGTVREAAVQQLARDGLKRVRQDLTAGAQQIAAAPDHALHAIRTAQQRLHQTVADAEAAAHQWTQKRAKAMARLAELRLQANAARQTAGHSGSEALRKADEAIAQADASVQQQRYPAAIAACDQAQTLLQQAAQASLDETVRRAVVRGLITALTEAGFVLEGPRLVNKKTDRGIVTLVGQLPSGRQARFEVHVDGRMDFDFDGYAGRACGTELARIERCLQERFGVQLGPQQVTWKNPDRISKGARDLPTDGRQREAR